LEETVYEAAVEIKNQDGLHMQPAMRLVDLANQFISDITISNGKDTVDGKSIMQVTMLAAVRGTKLTIQTKGEDAEKAINALRKFVEEQISSGSGQGKQQKQ
jgi:phosphocarrier protein HPr